ncbi:MAG: nucleoside deaminase [Candidatus Borkfalkiaceae bacterium]|nr:nucleoside deaminase [Eubacteriales bacterium]MDY5819966.1 nucleoside deaminase [Christensenellaceae bacterium]
MTEVEKFMKIALKEAKKAELKEEVPIGCVITLDGKVFAKAHNLRQTKRLATAHAEILAIEKACRKLGDWRLDGAEIYVTLEPCAMCAGAIANARIKKVYFGAYEKKGGGAVSKFNILSESGLNHVTDCEGGVLEEQCSSLLKEFFRSRRNGCPKNLDNLQ